MTAKQGGIELPQQCKRMAAEALTLVQVVFPGTCLQLLALPQQVRHKLDLEQIQSDLLHVAAQPPQSHPSATLFAPQDAFTKCDTGQALFVRPLDACFSIFSGQTGPEGQPVLNPNQLASDSSSSLSSQLADRPLNQTLPGHDTSAQPSPAFSQHKGALDICVGDAVSLTVELHSALPQAVQLEDVTLTLALLQEVTIAYSPKSATSSKTDFSRTVSSIKRATDSPVAPDSARTARSRSGDLAALADDADVTIQWQETEELVCSLSKEAHTSGTSGVGLGRESQSTAGMKLQADTAMVQPGLNRLTFRALPLKRGLYTLKHMDAILGSLTLHVPVMLTQPSELSSHSQSAPEHSTGHSMAGSETIGSRAATLGTVLNTGDIQQETVVLNVHSCRQRVAMSAAALRGTLFAGQPQWLAVAVMPLHDALHEACIHVGMASNRQPGSDPSAGSTALSASLGSRSSTASTSYTPEDLLPSHLPGLDILHPDRAVIAPLQSPAQQPQTQPQTSSSLQTQAAAPEQSGGAVVHGKQARIELPEQRAAVSASEAEGESGSGTSDLRYDAGPEASVSGSSWVSLEGSQGPNLPPWTATRPSLLWMWVQPGMGFGVMLAFCMRPCRTVLFHGVVCVACGHKIHAPCCYIIISL